MAHIQVLPDGRSKIVFEVYSHSGKRKRGSKVFPKNTSKANIKRFMAEKERDYFLQSNAGKCSFGMIRMLIKICQFRAFSDKNLLKIC